MAGGAPDGEGQFVVVGQSFHGFLLGPRCSSCFPGILGAEVDDAQDDSWRCCFTMWLYMAAKPAHVGSIWMG
jgi:hypothetical protein